MFHSTFANRMRAAEKTKPGDDRLSPAGRRVVELALREALSLGSGQIEPEHLLLAIIRHGEGPAAAYLREHKYLTASALTTFARGFSAGEKGVVRG